MQTVTEQISETFRDKESKFIGFLFPTTNKNEFEAKLEQIRSQYPDATHHCYAWRVNPTDLQEFAQDDGEPSGTAGLPILNQLKSGNLVNSAVVVVRYHGGTNLGKSGLIQAYGHTASLCIEKATLSPVIRTHKFELNYPYDKQNEIDKLKSTFQLVELDAEYLADVTLTLACRLTEAMNLQARLDRLQHLNITYKDLGKGFIVR